MKDWHPVFVMVYQVNYVSLIDNKRASERWQVVEMFVDVESKVVSLTCWNRKLTGRPASDGRGVG